MEKIKPIKSLGQNFLNDMNIKKKIVDSLDIQDGDEIIEIGPGTGALTEIILQNNISYLGIEIDSRAFEIIKNLTKVNEKFDVINQDILKVESEIFTSNSKVVGNLPYYITSSIIFKILEAKQKPKVSIFMVQKEVAQRLNGKVNTKDNGILAIAISLLGKAELLFDVSPNCFYPKPKVWSSVVKITFDKNLENFREILNFVKMAFNQRRKTLNNSIKSYIKDIDVTGLEAILSKRAEQLSADDFINLFNEINVRKVK